MKQQIYYPSTIGKQIAWLAHFRREFPAMAADLGVAPEMIEEVLNDADWLLYGLRGLREPLVHLTKAVTAYNKHLQTGKGTEAMVPPPLVFPASPTTQPPKPGALTRIFKMVQRLKHSPGYTRAMGLQLGIETNLFPEGESAAPTFKLKVVPGADHAVVEGRFRRYGQSAVWVESRRAGEDWAALNHGIFCGSVFRDERPLLVPGQPEYREYRLCFWDQDPFGEWSPVATVLVG